MLRHLTKRRRTHFVTLSILTIVYLGNVMLSGFKKPARETGIQNNEVEKFAGSASCAGCHKDIYESHIKTAHYLSSRLATEESIKGNFSEGKNKFAYNKWMEVVLERKKDTYFQTAYINGIEYQSEQFDIVIGSGRKGQTYLYWIGNKLYQLPVSYYTALDSWCNSPGYSTNFIKFNRIIPGQCIECHGTYAKVEENKDGVPVYDKSQIIYGIDCERCHGPGADHVAFYKAHPEEKTVNYIITTKKLDRQQRLDACALCHSGFRNATKPAFSFMVGDKLDDYSLANYSADSLSTLDVHGNQYGLLMASKCFKMSNQMDCSSCHNVHVDEADNAKIFSQRCIACHAGTQHTNFALSSGQRLLVNNNCVDCHMPMLSSQKIVLTIANNEKGVPEMVRTHLIGIYPENSKKFLKKIR